MDQLRILGGNRLSGVIHISGAKNAALPLMAASLLTEETLELSNLPHLADISTMTDLLAQLGVEIRMDAASPRSPACLAAAARRWTGASSWSPIRRASWWR